LTTYDLVTELTDDESRSVFEVYDAVFGDQPDYTTWRSEVWDRHRVRGGFHLARAYEGERLVGFGYGYTGERGQWWTDTCAAAVPADVDQGWFGGHFEVVTLAVPPSAQGHGHGAALMDHLLLGLPHDRALLSTYAADRPAPRHYARLGWTRLAHDVPRPGSDLWGLRRHPASG